MSLGNTDHHRCESGERILGHLSSPERLGDPRIDGGEGRSPRPIFWGAYFSRIYQAADTAAISLWLESAIRDSSGSQKSIKRLHVSGI
jgi:hypothetical protein